MSFDACASEAARQQAFEAVEIVMIMTGEGMSDRSGDSSKSTSSR
jgi:hypothetical protein